MELGVFKSQFHNDRNNPSISHTKTKSSDGAHMLMLLPPYNASYVEYIRRKALSNGQMSIHRRPTPADRPIFAFIARFESS
jgi:hypothetical protein